MPSNRIIIAGGSGFVGQALAGSLLAAGYEVSILTRPGAARNLRGSAVSWDGATVGDWAKTLDDALAVVNLTGKGINCRQTDANQREIVRSRVASVEVLGEAIRRCNLPPQSFIQATAVGFYGDSGDKVCDESTPPGSGFLGDTCRQWERAVADSLTPGVRRAVIRLGVVLGRNGGAFPPLASLARWFLGGAVGSGRQYLSWLHLADAVRIFVAAITRDDMSGVYVAASPNPVSNGDFMRELRTAMHRPWSPPVPALAVHFASLLTGINADLALIGQRCQPQRLLEQGFAFEFPELGAALRELVG